MAQIDYRLIRTKKLTGGITLRIHPEKGVIVRAPFWVPVKAVENFISDKSDWITGHLQNITDRKAVEKSYIHGEKHLFFGQEYSLVISHVDAPKRTSVLLDEESIVVELYRGHATEKQRSEIKEALLRWYLEEGIGAITNKVNTYTEKIGVSYSRIDIKKVSSIWGSCSPSNALSFNRKLIMAPHEIVDYVVIHEVCHMIERNHSSRFWALVARLDPDYRKHRGWLRKNHTLLSI